MKKAVKKKSVIKTSLRLGSVPMTTKTFLAQAKKIAQELSTAIVESNLCVVLESKNGATPAKKYVKADGWVMAGAFLGVVPITESCQPLDVSMGLGYIATVRLERTCDQKIIGRAAAICRLSEQDSLIDTEFATYSKTITRATGKAFRQVFGWLFKLSGFETVAAEELYEVEGTSEASEDVAKRKIEEKLGQKFETLAHAEAALMDRKEREKEERATAKRSVFITWPEAHKGLRFLVIGRLVIWEHGLAQEVEGVCGGLFSDRDGGWFVSASHAPYLRRKISEAGIPIIETDWERAEGAKSA